MSSRAVKIAIVALAAAVLAMGWYAYRLMRQAQGTPVKEARATVTPANSGNPGGRAVLMLASDADGRLRRREVATQLPADPGSRTRELIRLLLAAYAEKGSPHPLPAGAAVKEVFIIGGNTAVIDFNRDFADQHPSGVRVERLTVDSIAATLAANVPAIRRIKILIEDQERPTLAGHLDLSGFFEVK